MDDESFRCWTDELEWIACHERQNWTTGVAEYINVLGIHNYNRVDDIVILALERLDRNLIIFADLSERSEKSISMARDGCITTFAW